VNIDRLSQSLASSAYRPRGQGTGQSNAASAAGGLDGTSPGSSAAARATDGVEVSDQARTLQRAESAVRAAPDVREATVQALREQVQSGEYTTQDEAVARRLAGGTS
jgi:flagellar biosynthesis anti-sigma factor FlgM